MKLRILQCICILCGVVYSMQCVYNIPGSIWTSGLISGRYV